MVVRLMIMRIFVCVVVVVVVVAVFVWSVVTFDVCQRHCHRPLLLFECFVITHILY